MERGRCSFSTWKSGDLAKSIWSDVLFEESIHHLSCSKDTKLALACESHVKVLDYHLGYSSIQMETICQDPYDRIHVLDWTEDGSV